MKKPAILILLQLVLCLPAPGCWAAQRVMTYANPANAAEVDNTARYYHGKYYPQLRLVRAEDLREGDDVALMVGSPDVFPLLRRELSRFDVRVDSLTLTVGGAVYSKDSGLAIKWAGGSGEIELRTGPYWQSGWTTFYVSSAAAEAALSVAGSPAAYFVSYPAYPSGRMLRRGKFKLSSGNYLHDASEELAPDPCADFRRLMRSSTGTHITYYYKAGSWAERTIADFIPRTEREIVELKDYLGMKELKHMSYYLYDSLAEKEACTGVRGNGHAMPNAGEPAVFAVHCSTLSATGKHEFVHLFADVAWGPGPSKLMREGLAVEQDGGWSGKPFSYWGAELRRRKALPSLGTLVNDRSYWFKNSYEAYAAAGHFADFLMRKFGKEKFREMYTLEFTDANALRVFGKDLAALEKDWLEQIAAEESAGN